jgi:FKBP-type peptidyl-prolyl cis-trans isomerase 2
MGAMRGSAPIAAAATAALLLLPAPEARSEEPARAVVGPGRRVSIEYTLRLEDGTLVETSVGEEPHVYEHGKEELLPGLERALEGLAVGEAEQGTLEPAEAFGEIDPGLFLEVEAERIPEVDRRAGARLNYRDPSGEAQLVRVHEVRGDRIVVDMNHVYAGSPIRYEVRVVKIE